MATRGPKPTIILPAEEVFTAAQARACGVSEDQLRSKAVKRIFHGVYTGGDPAKLSVRARAALLIAGDGALLCEATGLRLLGVSLPQRFTAERDVHVLAAPGDSGPQVEGIVTHRSQLSQIPLIEGTWPVLDPIECWLQLAARAKLDELVIVADSLMKKGLVSAEELLPVVNARSGSRGVRVARQAVELARPGVASPLESRVRVALVQGGLPNPEVAYPLSDKRVHLQMAYPQALVGIEVDSGSPDPARREREILRWRGIEDSGWRIIVATLTDLRNPAALVRSVTRALGARSSD